MAGFSINSRPTYHRRGVQRKQDKLAQYAHSSTHERFQTTHQTQMERKESPDRLHIIFLQT